MMLQAVSMILSQVPQIEVVATSVTVGEAFEAVQALKPDVLVHELAFARASGIDLVRDVVAAHMGTSCLAFTRLGAATFAEHYFRAGGRGFVPKADSSECLGRAILVVAQGGIFISENEAGRLLDHMAHDRGAANGPTLKALSTSEFQVLQLISQGMSNRDIAAALHRSVKTVETYRSRIKKKLGLSNGVELAQFAVLNLREQIPQPGQ